MRAKFFFENLEEEMKTELGWGGVGWWRGVWGERKNANIRILKSYSNIRIRFEYSTIRIFVAILTNYCTDCMIF